MNTQKVMSDASFENGDESKGERLLLATSATAIPPRLNRLAEAEPSPGLLLHEVSADGDPIAIDDVLKGNKNPLFPWLYNGYLLGYQKHFAESPEHWPSALEGRPSAKTSASTDTQNGKRSQGVIANKLLQLVNASYSGIWTGPANSESKPWMALIQHSPTSGYAGDYGVQKIWDEGIRGQGIKVGVNDNGLIREHADFDYALVDGSGYLLNDGESPLLRGNQHGTAVAGIIGARANGRGVVGVAHAGDLWTANRFNVQFVESAIEAGCDVVNNSWGPTEQEVLDRFGYREHGHREFKKAARGRSELGLSLVFSAGNRRDWDTAVLSTTNHENVITVAAVDINTQVIDWSTPGDAVHVSALGMGNIMANGNDLTGVTLRIHDGSNYAAPFVSGVVALMYQANAGLGLRDVQAILAHSAGLPQSGGAGFRANGGRHANGGGLHFSRDYGFGLVNAHKAVRLAQSWFAGGTVAQSGMNRQYTEIRSHRRTDTSGQDITLKFTAAEARELEHVKLFLELNVSNIKDLKIVVVSPQGTESVLMDNFGRGGSAFNSVLDLGSRRFWGENAAGEWTVLVSSRQSLLEVRHPVLLLAGGHDTPDDRYVYTDVFNALAAADPWRLVLEDADGGNNTFNAACVSSDAVIDLRAGNFSFADGPQGRIAAGTVIRQVVGGEGNDWIIGGEQVVNTLYGGCGNDTLSGGVGADTLFGGQGNDTYMINNRDTLIVERAGEGIDAVISSVHYRLAEHLESLKLTGTAAIVGMGNALDNRLEGNAAANILDGGEGDDTVSGGEGNDSPFTLGRSWQRHPHGWRGKR